MNFEPAPLKKLGPKITTMFNFQMLRFSVRGKSRKEMTAQRSKEKKIDWTHTRVGIFTSSTYYCGLYFILPSKAFLPFFLFVKFFFSFSFFSVSLSFSLLFSSVFLLLFFVFFFDLLFFSFLPHPITAPSSLCFFFSFNFTSFSSYFSYFLLFFVSFIIFSLFHRFLFLPLIPFPFSSPFLFTNFLLHIIVIEPLTIKGDAGLQIYENPKYP